MTPSSPEILKHTPEAPKKVLELSRKALAEKLGISEAELPDGKFFRIVDEQLDRLAGLDPKKKAKEMKEKLQAIDVAEAKDRAEELIESGKNLGAQEALQYVDVGVKKATETLKTEGIAVTKGAVEAVGAIATAGSISEATKGIHSLSDAIDAGGKMLNKAFDSIAGIFSSLFKALGLDRLFASIGRLFGFEMKENDTKTSDTKTKDASSAEDPEKKNPVQGAIDRARDVVQSPEKRAEVIELFTKNLSNDISKKYFHGNTLGEEQIRKIKKIIDTSLDTESFQKVVDRLEKGQVNIGEATHALLDVGGLFPAKVLFRLAFSGIIPYWDIAQHAVVEPGKSVIRLTLNAYGASGVELPFSEWSELFQNDMKDDPHVRDVARIQLYRVQGILWGLTGQILGDAAALGIMATDTVSKTNGITMARDTLAKKYGNVAQDVEKIEKMLGIGKPGSTLNMVIQGVQDVQKNARLLQIVADAGDEPQKILAALKNSEFATHINDLSRYANDPNQFRNALSNIIKTESTVKNLTQGASQNIAKYLGGQEGVAMHRLEEINKIKNIQKELILTTGMKEKLTRMSLAMATLKMARSGDTLALHLNNAEDVARFRAFLSVIPGGIKALGQMLPAGALVISLSSIAADALQHEDKDTKTKMLDTLVYSVFPLYGSGSFLMSKTIDLNATISQGKMPTFGDFALTGAMGGVAVYELTRVSKGVGEIAKGVAGLDGKLIAKGASRITYIGDIAKSGGYIIRGSRNILALAKTPISSPAVTKSLTTIATKLPRKGILAIGAGLLVGSGAAYAYIRGPETPETVLSSLKKDGWLDEKGKITDKLRDEFLTKTPEEKKQIIDELFIVHIGRSEGLPKTHIEDQAYTIVGDPKQYSFLIESEFRNVIQALGVDIALMPPEEKK